MKQKFNGLVQLKTITMGLDRAEEQNVYHGHVAGNSKKTNKYLGVFNLDKNELSCVATNKYKIIQHREAFEALIDEIQGYGLNVSGTVKNEGDYVSYEMVFDNANIEDGEKGIKLGIKVTNSYNLKSGLNGELYGFRLICTNGMMLGKVISDITLRKHHIGKIGELKQVFREFIKKAISSQVQFKEIISEAMKDSIEWQYAEKILESMFKINKYRDMIVDRLKEIHTEGQKITRWDLYNVVTDVATHGNDLKTSIEDFMQNNAQKILINEIEVENDR